VALISDVVAARYWGHEDPIGRLVRLHADEARSPWVTIVGVVGDVRNPLALDVQPTAYRPHAQNATGIALLMIRTAGEPMAFAEAVRKEIRAVDPDGPEFRVADLEAAVWNYVSPQRFTTSVIGVFALLGVLLAAVGVHGVMRHWVSMRIFDIGVRMALGAEPRDVLWLVLSRAGKATLLGLAFGMAGAVALQRVIGSLLYGVSPTDPIVLAMVAALLGAIALVAALVPARWAATVNPVVALRCE
jgi:ABC-type antimicrobial peptide transport system permease subunit